MHAPTSYYINFIKIILSIQDAKARDHQKSKQPDFENI